MKNKIYAHNVKNVKDYGIGESTNVTINGQAVIPILADKIYKSPYSAIRELYVNEITATKKALRINQSLKPKIEITLDTNSRELVIKGINSLGVDRDTFKNILAVMGNSGNGNQNETGFYGLGFYSFVKLSERIIINSYSLESGEKWACIAKSALKFEELKPENFEALNKTGFEITLSIKNELNFDSITDTIKEISKLSGVKTTFHIDQVEIPLDQYKNLMCYFMSIYPRWFNEKNKPYSLMYEYINNDDYELIIGHLSGNIDENTNETFLINVPIELNKHGFNMPEIMLLNVKNEHKYKPSADRERFDESDEEKLTDIILFHKFDEDSKLPKIHNINEWYDSKYKWFISHINEESIRYIEVKTGEKSIRGKAKTEYLKDVLPAKKPNKFLVSNTLRTNQFKKHALKNEFAVKSDTRSDYDHLIKIGFVDIDSESPKSEPKNRNKKRTLSNDFKFHQNYDIYDKLPDYASAVIRLPHVRGNILLNKIRSKNIFFIGKNANYTGDLEIDFDDIYTLLDPNKIYATNKGYMTASKIINKKLKSYYKNTNNDYDVNDDHGGKYLLDLFGYHLDELIIVFDNSDDSDILNSILSINSDTYIHERNFDYYKIKHENNNLNFDVWTRSIKEETLVKLLEHNDFRFSGESQELITELQEKLKKV